MDKKWLVYAKKADFQAIAQKFGIDQVTARVIRNRDVIGDEAIEAYLHGTLAGLPSEKLLPDGETASDCLLSKLRAGAHIRIVGDYDIDGVCSVYILYKGLLRAAEAVSVPCPLGMLMSEMLCEERGSSGKAAALRPCIDYAVPDRIKDGYGINRQIIDAALADGVDTILTCDNGIAAIEELRYAKERGMTVIVTDHHDVRRTKEDEELLPPADAIVNPKLERSLYPANVCGAVVAWKLLWLLYENLGISREEWLSFLPFAAIATVGDVMVLQEENRILVKHGLFALNHGAGSLGLSKLIETCGLSGKRITAYHIGFVIGPCINAGGRLETAETALKLFLCEDEAKAEHYALHLKQLNDERKEMTERGVKEAAEQAETQYADDRVLVIYLPKLHEALAGIVAGRIRERFGKPCFVLTDGQDCCKGSGRSIEKYHMFEQLCGVAELLLKFGGHPMAAGLSLMRENIGALRAELNQRAALTEADFQQTLWIDVPMPLSYISEQLIKELGLLEPFGNGNEKPVFAAKGVRATDLLVLGKNRNVLKCQIREPGGFTIPAVLFGEADRMKAELSSYRSMNIVYYPEINEYNGYRSLQIVIGEYKGV